MKMVGTCLATATPKQFVHYELLHVLYLRAGIVALTIQQAAIYVPPKCRGMYLICPTQLRGIQSRYVIIQTVLYDSLYFLGDYFRTNDTVNRKCRE
jgi:hypothetical protein